MRPELTACLGTRGKVAVGGTVLEGLSFDPSRLDTGTLGNISRESIDSLPRLLRALLLRPFQAGALMWEIPCAPQCAES